MKEATGEVSMTVVTLVAIAVVGAIIAAMWPSIKGKINDLWNGSSGTSCPAGQYFDTAQGRCVNA